MVLSVASPWTVTPSKPLPRATVPVESVPMKSPATTLPDVPARRSRRRVGVARDDVARAGGGPDGDSADGVVRGTGLTMSRPLIALGIAAEGRRALVPM